MIYLLLALCCYASNFAPIKLEYFTLYCGQNINLDTSAHLLLTERPDMTLLEIAKKLKVTYEIDPVNTFNMRFSLNEELYEIKCLIHQ